MQVPPFPTHIQIQTTSACGAKCAICPHPRLSPAWPNRLMSDALFHELVTQLRGRPVEYLSPYLMADPLSDKKIFERITALRSVLPQTHFELSTTGLYLSERNRAQLLAAPLSELRISSHGLSAEEYAETMPSVDFERALANIRAFIDAWCRTRPYPLSIVSLWGLWSAEREAEIEAYWSELGVALSKWRVVSRARQVNLTLFGESSTDPTAYRSGKREPPYVCRFQRDTHWMHILSDGRVTLCCMDYGQEQILGDVRHSTLAEIWNGAAYNAARARVHGDTPTERTFLCNRCEWHLSRSVVEGQGAPEQAARLAVGSVG